MKSNTANFAQKELDILITSTPDAIIKPFIPEILLLCEKFGLSGQSGGSAPHTAKALSQAIESLCLQNPICPVTGIDEEWMDVTEDNGGNKMYQNKRCFALFKAFDVIPAYNYAPYYLDAIVYVDADGVGFTGSALLDVADDFIHPPKKVKRGVAYQSITSRQYIKGFPFIPKTFYVDVIRKEVAKDNWDTYIKDANQIEEVFKYYQIKP